jgi:hypothetical protein
LGKTKQNDKNSLDKPKVPLLISKTDNPPPAHNSLLYFKIQWIHTTTKIAKQMTVIVKV